MKDGDKRKFGAAELAEADERAQTASERALLCIVLTEASDAIPVVSRFGIVGADFASEARGAVLDAALSMFKTGEAVDAATVGERLCERERPDAMDECEKSLDADALPAHLEAHCRDVFRRALRRRVVSIANDLADEAEKPGAKPLRIAGSAVERLSALLLADKGEKSTADEVDGIVKEWEDLADRKRERRGAELPTHALQTLIGRLEPGLHILAAKTSAGKSTLESQIVRNLALNGKRALRCFLDMARRDLLARDLAALCFLSLRNMDQGKMTADERVILELARVAWRDYLRVDSLIVPTLSEIVGRARALHADKGLDLVTVDFVQNVQTGNPKIDATGNANVRIGEVTKTLKTFSIELGVPVLLLSQLNRADRDESRAPILSDLRDSGNIEQDARTVSFLYPDLGMAGEWVAKHAKDGAQTWRDLAVRPVWLTVAKNQQGRLGSVPLRMTCNLFSVEDTGRNQDRSPRWCYSAGSRNGDPVPVIARTADGITGAFDPRFLSLVNAVAQKQGRPAFDAVETVENGLEAVADRLAAWRAKK